MTEKQTRFVIVGFDGLRPDCIDEDMPTLSALHSLPDHTVGVVI